MNTPDTMTGPREYIPRATRVTAIRYQPDRNCAAVHDFLGYAHDEEACSPDASLQIEGRFLAAPGDWVLRGEDGAFQVLSHTVFTASYGPHVGDD